MLQKGILEYDLSDVDAASAFNYAVNGFNYYMILKAVDDKLRHDYKYGTDGAIIEYALSIRQMIAEEARDKGVKYE